MQTQMILPSRHPSQQLFYSRAVNFQKALGVYREYITSNSTGPTGLLGRIKVRWKNLSTEWSDLPIWKNNWRIIEIPITLEVCSASSYHIKKSQMAQPLLIRSSGPSLKYYIKSSLAPESKAGTLLRYKHVRIQNRVRAHLHSLLFTCWSCLFTRSSRKKAWNKRLQVSHRERTSKLIESTVHFSLFSWVRVNSGSFSQSVSCREEAWLGSSHHRIPVFPNWSQ